MRTWRRGGLGLRFVAVRAQRDDGGAVAAPPLAAGAGDGCAFAIAHQVGGTRLELHARRPPPPG